MEMNNKKLLAIAVVAIVVIAAAAVAVYYGLGNNNNNDPSANWNEVLKEADGQTVNMGFYAEAKTIPFLNDVLIPEAEKLGVTVTYASYGPLAANTSKAEMDAGKTTGGTFDLIWGDTNPYTILFQEGKYNYLYGNNWSNALPNKNLLSSGAYDALKLQVNGYKDGTACEFSNGQTMLVYCTDFNAYTAKVGIVDVSIPYNCVVLYNDGAIKGFIKVCATGGESYTSSSTIIPVGSVDSTSALIEEMESAPAYNIDSVRTTTKSLAGNSDGTVKGYLKYGLPHDFTELISWAEIYKGQITYPDPNNAQATFHTNLLFQAMIYELEWNSDKTDWQVASDRSANVSKITKLINDGKLNTQEDFDKELGYLYKYLKDLDPYTNKTIGYLGSNQQITKINSKIVGNADTDKDYTDSTVMIGMTTVTALDMRQDQYNFNIGTFSLDTGVKSQYYLVIPSNSSNKAGAMVVSNLLLDPSIQAKWFQYTGNGYNIDTSKTYSGDSQTIYEKYFGFTKDWTMYLSQDVLKDVTVNGGLTGKSTYLAGLWTKYINS